MTWIPWLLAAAVLVLLTWRHVSARAESRRLRRELQRADEIGEALRREEARFRTLVERGSDVISLIEADGTMVYQSANIQHILGYTPAQLAGRTVFDYIHPEDVAGMQRVWAEMLRRPGVPVATGEYRFRHGDGSWRWLESVGRNLIDDPDIGAILGNSHDVTDRRRATEALRVTEEQFRQSQKMEAVGRLAGGIAHDFNNLLTAIQGYTKLLLEEVPAESPMRQDLEQVQRGAERAADLTRQLLAFSRRQMLHSRVLQLNTILEQMHEMLSRLIGEHIIMRLDLDPRLGAIRADAGQVEQVILNLVLNARDAMPDGGVLELRTRNADIDEEEAARFPFPVVTGPYVRLDIADNGAGIADDVMPHIFEPFFTTKEAGRGTGLGLSTVYGVVKQSGGYVVSSSGGPGSGTTFRIYLPRVQSAPEPAPVESTGVVDVRGGETVLVVEDEESVRKLTGRLLQRAGYHVLSAHDGASAIELCRGYRGDIHLVVTDVVMPGMNGRELVERLGTMRPGIRSIYASGYTRDSIIEQGVLTSDIVFIEKPYDAGMLTRKVREVLDGVAG